MTTVKLNLRGDLPPGFDLLVKSDCSAIADEVVEKDAFGGKSLVFEQAAMKPIRKILSGYERNGIEAKVLDSSREGEGEETVIVLRPWAGYSRHLACGGYQVRKDGRLFNYPTKAAYRADSPMRDERPLSAFSVGPC